jgi:hypothetical protein
MKKPSLLLTQCTRNHEFVIGEKSLVSIGLMQHLSLVELRERKIIHLLHENTTTV